MTQYIFEDAGRQVAHVLLDGAIAYEPHAEDAAEAVNLALSRVDDLDGAVPVSMNDAGDGVLVDLSHLLGGALITINRLLEIAAEARGEDREVVAADVRAFLDTER